MNPRRLVTPGFVIAHVIVLHLVVVWFTGPGRSVVATPQSTLEAAEEAVLPTSPQAMLEPYQAPVSRPGPLDFSQIYEDEGRFFADLGNGWTAELATDATLQAAATKALDRAKVPFGAVVVLDVKTGDVLAMADRYDETHAVAPKLDPKGPPHLALRAVAPSASVFKVITAAALIDGGISTQKQFAFTPAKRRIYEKDLEPGPGAPKDDIGHALATSNNGLFSRLADRYLDRDRLDATVRRFGFNQVIPFPVLTEASTAKVPRNRLERARMAAGFWHNRMTPMHGAVLAAAVAGNGQMLTPRLVRRLTGPDGRTVDAPASKPFATVMRPETAAKLRPMMAQTVRSGTGRRAFQKWPASLKHIRVAGKTGSLAKREPYTYYTWFVGFAPADDPQIAIAVMVGNGELWWQRAIDVARETLATHFKAVEKRKKAQLAAR